MTDQDFGAKLKQLREKAGLSQLDLAARIDVSPRTMTRLETGETSATWPTILAICEHLGVSCEEFKVTAGGKAGKPKMGRPPRKAAD